MVCGAQIYGECAPHARSAVLRANARQTEPSAEPLCKSEPCRMTAAACYMGITTRVGPSGSRHSTQSGRGSYKPGHSARAAPRPTSQTCSECGAWDRTHRKSEAVFDYRVPRFMPFFPVLRRMTASRGVASGAPAARQRRAGRRLAGLARRESVGFQRRRWRGGVFVGSALPAADLAVQAGHGCSFRSCVKRRML
jgi:hypothetical protein